MEKSFHENFPRQHFISYGDDLFQDSKKRIKQEAENFGTFASINIYSPKDLPEKFFTMFQDILNCKKGGGYWIWKHFLLSKKLEEINDGEFIIYCDAGCSLNKKGIQRYYEYLNMLNSSKLGVLSFPLSSLENPFHLPEKHWTTKEIFKYFSVKMDSEIANSSQLVGGIVILQKNSKSEELLKSYSQVLKNDKKLITDYYNYSQFPFFIDARHDQSIFSVLRKVQGTLILPFDESYFSKNDREYFFDNPMAEKYPFWATRIRK